MKARFRRAVGILGTALVPTIATFFLTACGGGSAQLRGEMPNELEGFDVVVEPGVSVSGEGARQHSGFGEALVSAIESRLVSEGFDVVSKDQAARAVRVQLRAHVDISRNQFLMVNGKPLESSEARVQVKLVAAEGGLLDAFDVSGDPDGETAARIATQLAERMKRSRRLVAIAKGRPSPSAPIAATTSETDTKAEPKKAPARSRTSKTIWPDVSQKLKGQNDGTRDAAVIVAIEDYAELTDIPGAVANGEAWFRYLVDTRGVPRGHVQMLVNDTARDQQILKAVKQAATQAQRGGKLWFVFIGHGAPSSDHQGLLVGFDAYQTAEGIADRSVKTNELLKEVSAVEATPIIVLDACFSGRSARGDALVAGLQPTTVVKTNAPSTALVLTAAQSNQFAGALPGDERPAFSYLALGALRGWADKDENGTVTAKEVEHYVGDTLRLLLAGKRQQTPTLEGGRGDFVLANAVEKEPGGIVGSVLETRGEE